MIFAAAMSLTVSLCYQMHQAGQQDFHETVVACLRNAFHQAVVACNHEQTLAAQRLGAEQGKILDRSQDNWVKVLGETCKVPLGADGFVDTKPDTTDFECLIDLTHERTRALSELGR